MAKKRDLQGQADQLAKTTAYDRTLDATIDGVSALVPFAGPLVAGLLRQVAPRDDRIYLAGFAKDVAAAIDQLDATKIDRTYFESEEWAEDAGRVFDSVAQIRNRRKRAQFVAALAKSAPIDRPEEQERHRFLDVLDAIRPSHLRLLAAAVTALSMEDRAGGFDDWVRYRLPHHDVENVRLDWDDLSRAGFVQGVPSGIATTTIERRIQSAVNAIGVRFAAFVEADTATEE